MMNKKERKDMKISKKEFNKKIMKESKHKKLSNFEILYSLYLKLLKKQFIIL
jgi:hypothetical protein